MPSPPVAAGRVQLNATRATPEHRWRLLVWAKDGERSSLPPAAMVSSTVIVAVSPSSSLAV